MRCDQITLLNLSDTDSVTGNKVCLYGATKASGGADFPENPDVSKVYLTWEHLTVLYKNTSVTKSFSRFKAGKNYEEIEDTETVRILSDVSGVAKPGDLIAIMGASGSGKTSLLNTLACRNSRNLDVSGFVKINGQQISKDIIKDVSGYVEQNDTFMASMTASEVLFFYASLMLHDQSLTREEKEDKAIRILKKVGLYKVKDCFVGDINNPGLSGGEKRRLAVATQLLSEPSLIFLDEVTSGLDSFMAESVIDTIRNLSMTGCTILCTIHQPASAVYEMFDKVCLMSEGSVAFLGNKTDALTYFESIGHKCPPTHCPADHFIRTLAIRPDDEQTCRETCSTIVESYKTSSFYQSVVDDIESITKFAVEKMHGGTNSSLKIKKRSPFGTQFAENFKRSLREIKRNPKHTRARIISAIIISVFLGVIFLNTSNKLDTVGINKGGMFFVLVVVQVSRATNFAAHAMTLELPIVKREYKNGLYSTLPYLISMAISEMLFTVHSALIELTIIYFMVGLKRSASAFFNAFSCVVVLRFTGNSIGWFVGALVEEPKAATSVGTVIGVPFIILSGVVASDTNIPRYLLPIKYLSYMRYAYRTLMVNEFVDLQLDCGDKECTFNGTKILIDKGISSNEAWWPNMACNFVIGLGFVAMTALVLIHKTRRN